MKPEQEKKHEEIIKKIDAKHTLKTPEIKEQEKIKPKKQKNKIIVTTTILTTIIILTMITVIPTQNAETKIQTINGKIYSIGMTAQITGNKNQNNINAQIKYQDYNAPISLTLDPTWHTLKGNGILFGENYYFNGYYMQIGEMIFGIVFCNGLSGTFNLNIS